jgi:hypothetical protein
MRNTINVLRRLLLAGLLSGASPLAAGQEVLSTDQSLTSTTAPGAIFSSLNPGLADYPDFTAGDSWAETGDPISLGHSSGNGLPLGSSAAPPAAARLGAP